MWPLARFICSVRPRLSRRFNSYSRSSIICNSRQTTFTGKKGKAVAVHAMKAYREKRVTAALILTLDVRWKWVVDTKLLPLYSGTNGIERWVGPRAGIDFGWDSNLSSRRYLITASISPTLPSAPVRTEQRTQFLSYKDQWRRFIGNVCGLLRAVVVVFVRIETDPDVYTKFSKR
jgi:hypothetical protein